MRRPGHLRPPSLGDVIVETDGPNGDPDELDRAYLVTGVEETRTGHRLLVERVAYGTLPDTLDPEAIWPSYKVAPRR